MATSNNNHRVHPASADAPARGGAAFDLRALLDGPGADPVGLMEEHINPSFARVLRTIGFDPTYVRGEGAYLFDDQGNRYIDCLGGYAVFALGRNHPVIKDAIRQALDLDLPNLPGVGPFRTAGLLAKELLAVAPGNAGGAPPGGAGLDTVFFTSSGSEAVEVALKYARVFTGRERFVYCSKSYHGLTLGSLSVNGNADFRDGFGSLLNASEVPFNDLAALEQELRRGQVAAFVVEPIQGKGVHIPAAGYLAGAQELCRRYGAVLIADEIQTGFGRTGAMFACDHWGFVPDMMVVAKALSGGLVPVGAVLTRRDIHTATFSSLDRCSRMQTTFGMNDLAMVAGLATLHALRTERLVEHTAHVGDYLLASLRERLAPYQMVKDVRGKGLMIAIEFASPKSLGLKVGWNLLHSVDHSLFCQAILMPLFSEHRILAQVAGHRQDVIKLIPPLVLSKADCDQVVNALDATIGACHTFPGPAWEVGKKLTAAAMKRMAPAKA
ncbi:MAG: aspartate aminotransferase family protein [Phycisphaeraceae bacterium]|nr:aspartate aminotransferase family protein [Phycisphaeraceae bacterium]